MKPFFATLAVMLAAVVVAQRGGRAQRHRNGRQQDPAQGNYGAPQATYREPDVAASSGSESTSDHQGLDWLLKSIPGQPGTDYPILAEVPDTGFVCDGQVNGGYYADTETECQAFHVCTADGTGGLSKYSFLCPNGTIFNQEYFICDWWFNFDCSEAEGLYSRNDEVAAERDAATQPQGAATSPQASYAEPAQASYGAGGGRQGRRGKK